MFNPTLLGKCQCCGKKADSIIILDRYPDQLMQICDECVQERAADFKVVASTFGVAKPRVLSHPAYRQAAVSLLRRLEA